MVVWVLKAFCHDRRAIVSKLVSHVTSLYYYNTIGIGHEEEMIWSYRLNLSYNVHLSGYCVAMHNKLQTT